MSEAGTGRLRLLKPGRLINRGKREGETEKRRVGEWEKGREKREIDR
jgi:hypothetical protein